MHGDCKRAKARGRSSYSLFEYLCSVCKTLTNPITMFNKSFVNHLTDFKPPNRFNNLFNPNMNNVEAIDFTRHTLTADTDGVLQRWSTEFPRISFNYQTKADIEGKPWGSKSDPIYVDLCEDAKLTLLHSCSRDTTLSSASLTSGNKRGAYEKGVWYYSGMPLTDHHELAGFENPNRVLQTWLGTEYRP